MARRRVSSSWEQYRLIADNSSDVVYEVDPTGLVSWIQPTVESLLGWTAEELRGTPARALVHPDDADVVDALNATVDSGDDVDETPCRFRTASGGFRQCSLRARPLRDGSGEVTGAVVALRDVHRQTAALRALATLSRGNEVLVRASDEGGLLQAMCDAIAEAGDYSLVWYGRPLRDAERTVQPVAAAGVERSYVDDVRVSWGDDPLGQGPTGLAIRTRETQVRNDVASDPSYRPWLTQARRHGMTCSLSLPVVVGDEVDGALMVYAAEPGSFDDLARTLFEDLAADIGFGLARLRDARELERTRSEAEEAAGRLRATIDSLIDPFVLLESVRDATGSLVDLRYVEGNRAALDYNRVTRDALLRTTMRALYPGVQGHSLLAACFDAIERNAPMVLDDIPYFNEIRGEERRYDLRGAPHGDGLALTWRDVTDRHAAAEALARSQEEYRLLAEHASDFVLRSTPDGVIEWTSPAITRALGWAPRDVLGRTVFDLCHPEDRDRVRANSARLNAGDPVSQRMRLAQPDGSYRWFQTTVRPVLGPSGDVVARVGAWHDVQDEVDAQEAREASEARFRSAMQAAAIGMAVTDPDGRFRLVNRALCRMLDREETWLLAHALSDVIHPDDLAPAEDDRRRLMTGGQRSSVLEHRFVRSDGSLIWVRHVSAVVRDPHGGPESVVVQVEDVTAERRAADQLEFQAFHDSLTGLRNRTWVMGMLESDLAAARRDGSSVGVLFADLDNFKVVNDSLGHVAGDDMLAVVARRIAATLTGDLRVGRFGGDEFLVVVPRVSDAHDLERVAARVTEALAAPLTVQGHGVVTSASMGLAVSTDRSTPASLLRDADAALFRAKASGRARWQLFDEAMHAEAVQRLTVEDELRRALEADELTAYYQPLVALADRSLAGYEALVRWAHPARGVLTPSAFLAVAEDSGLVVEVGQRVLEQVCALLASAPGLPGTVSVNVSAVQLGRADWAQRVRATLERYAVEPRRIVLEVTETAVLSVIDSVLDDLVALRALGVGLHVDDFGTGYSSIALLRDLPVTGLKLDRTFVSGLTVEDSQANALSAGLAGLATNLHLDAIAEGIETDVQAAILRAHGWRHGQGYLFGGPEPDVRRP